MVALGEIMTRDVATTSADAPMTEVAETMVRGRFGSVVVTTGSTLVGIVTERDVLRAAAEARDLTADTVRNWMTPDPVTATSDSDSAQAESTMMGQGFRHLPVVDGGRLVGIVSLRDLLSARIHGRAG